MNKNRELTNAEFFEGHLLFHRGRGDWTIIKKGNIEVIDAGLNSKHNDSCYIIIIDKETIHINSTKELLCFLNEKNN